MDHEDGWWGGTAIITGVAGATPSLYLALVFNGVFPKGAASSHLVKIVLTLPEKNQTIIDQVTLDTTILFHTISRSENIFVCSPNENELSSMKHCLLIVA